MSANTSISWSDHTFNPWWGCAKVSPACDHCYAERDAKRFAAGRVLWGVDAERREFGDKHWAEPTKWNAAAEREGKRARVFCASMADVFDKNAPDGARARLWELIKATPSLDWLLLTKRIGNAERMFPVDWLDYGGPGYPNVWLGATVVTQEEADRDAPKLLATSARVRFLSIEPMLGAINLRHFFPAMPANPRAIGMEQPAWDALGGRCLQSGHPVARLHWVICGGESGPGARPMHPDWARSLRDQCAAAGVAFHFKQWGEWLPAETDKPGDGECYAVAEDGSDREISGRAALTTVHGQEFLKVGKARAGRLLDGVEHNGFPA